MDTKAFPFRLDRDCPEPLTVQLYGGIARAIDSGYWRPGDVLPTLEEISASTGVSMIVARHAVRRLVKEGMVNSRPGIGTVVVDRGAELWRGNVLIVLFETRPNYHYSRVSGILQETLLKAGYMPSVVSALERSERKYDLSPLETILRQPFRLAVVLSELGDAAAIRKIRKAGVPVLSCSSRSRPLPGVVGHVIQCESEAEAAFAEHCASRGVRRVVQFHARMNKVALAVEQLAERRIEVVDCAFENAAGVDPIENVQIGALQALDAWLARDGIRPGDVIDVNDDYAATAIMMNLLHRGIRIPDDVRLVSWMNKGSAPPYPGGVTGVELDPFLVGGILSGMVVNFLEGRKFEKVAAVPMRFLVGETFP